jgi:hypothetical protein
MKLGALQAVEDMLEFQRACGEEECLRAVGWWDGGAYDERFTLNCAAVLITYRL